MLAGLKSRLDQSELDDLRLLFRRSILLSRPLIGFGAGFVLYFFFLSGLVTGPAFPDALMEVKKDLVKNFGLLAVWAFLAGFSERLVPSLLTTTETRLQDEPPARLPSE